MLFKKFMFVFSLNNNYILSNRIYILSDHVNIGLKILSNVSNTVVVLLGFQKGFCHKITKDLPIVNCSLWVLP